MKRKTHNNSNTEEKSKSQESDKDIYSIFKRRRQEIFEIVSKENAINRHRKRQESTVSDAACTTSYGSSESEELDNEDKNNMRKFTFKERQRVLKHCKIICRNNAKTALDLLENNTKPAKKKLTNEKKQINMLEKHCTKNISPFQEEHEHAWDSSMYIVKSIRACILTRNWNNLTYLLLMLLKNKKRYVSYVRQVAILNLMNNPLDYNGDILEELHKLCTASAHK